MTRFVIALAIWLTACAFGVSVARAASPLSACVPLTQPQGVSLQMGVHIALVCTNAARAAPYAAGFSCLHSTCNKDAFIASVIRVAMAPDRAKAVDAEWAANIKWTCDAPPNDRAMALCAERKAWIKANWAEWTKP